MKLLSLFLLLPFSAAYAAGSPTPTRTTLAAAGTTLTAAVRTATGEPVPAGTVDFLLPSGQSLGSALLGADGAATLIPGQLPPGTQQTLTGAAALPITAVYQPSGPAAGLDGESGSSFAASTSAPTAVPTPQATVTPDFILTGNPTTVTATRGAYATTTITVASVGGYAGAVQLSCTGLPAQVTCAFNPTQQTLAANGTFTTTLQLETQGPSGTASSSLRRPAQLQSSSTHTGLALALAFPGAFFLFGFARTRRFGGIAPLLAATLLLSAAALTLSGCSQRYGYLHHPPPVAGGTPTGAFPITVVVDGNQGAAALEHTLSISLVVQ